MAAEAKYEALLMKADSAFRAKDYPTARMAYAEAIPYNEEKETWLTSKINDLDILMAKNIARSVDSLQRVPLADATVTISLPKEENQIEVRPVPELETMPVGGEEDVIEEPLEETEVPEAMSKDTARPPQESENKPLVANPPAEQETENDFLDFSRYEYGITEEHFDMKNHTVLRIIVKDRLDTIVYKKVKHTWGGEFYFKDDVSIVQRIWEEEVSQYRDKFNSNSN